MKAALKLSPQSRSKGLLGTLLLNQQLVTQNQLDKAIEHQCSHGGRLGTCLLETHCIEEEKLTRVLNQQWQRPYFSSMMLMNIPRDVLEVLTAKLICKHNILPFKTDNDYLYLAVTNCRELSLFEELETLTDKQIVPVLFSDMRLAVALNKYFSTPLLPRYEKLAITVSKQQFNLSKPLPGQGEKFTPLQNNKIRQATPKQLSPTAEKTAPPPNRSPYDLFTDHLLQAKNNEDVLGALFGYLKNTCVSAALFILKNQHIHGWDCLNQDKTKGVANFESAIQDFPLLNKVVTERIIHYGNCPAEFKQDSLEGVFSQPEDHYFLCAPLSIKERTFAALCLELKDQQSKQQLHLYKNICQKLELAFQLLIIKSKIIAAPDEADE